MRKSPLHRSKNHEIARFKRLEESGKGAAPDRLRESLLFGDVLPIFCGGRSSLVSTLNLPDQDSIGAIRLSIAARAESA